MSKNDSQHRADKQSPMVLLGFAVTGMVVLAVVSLVLSTLATEAEWVYLTQDEAGNRYSVDKLHTLTRLKDAKNVAGLEAKPTSLARQPYAVKVQYADDSRELKGYQVISVLEQGFLNCSDSRVDPGKWQFLSWSEMPIRLDQDSEREGILFHPTVRQRVIEYVCSLQ